MRPFVVLKYYSGSVWTRSTPSAADDEPRLENQGPADAYDVKVSALAVDGEAEYSFARVPVLLRQDALPLDACIRPIDPPLAQAISRSIVKRVLAGGEPTTRWPVRISYQDDGGRAYATACEIRVVRMPLELAS